MEQKEIALIGKIAAGMTHDMKNVLAIINESAGLIQDIFAYSSKNANPVDKMDKMDKVERALNSVKKQIDRGADIMTKFNRFAHSMDEPVSQVTANEIVEQVVFLMHRFAGQKQIELIAKPRRRDKNFSTNPIRLLLAICMYVDYYLSELSEAKKIILMPIKSSKEIVFGIVIKGYSGKEKNDRVSFAELPEMGDTLNFLNAGIHPLKSPDQPGVKFVISE